MNEAQTEIDGPSYAKGADAERLIIVEHLRHMAGSWSRNGDLNHDNDARLLRTAADFIEAGKHLPGDDDD